VSNGIPNLLTGQQEEARLKHRYVEFVEVLVGGSYGRGVRSIAQYACMQDVGVKRRYVGDTVLAAAQAVCFSY